MNFERAYGQWLVGELNAKTASKFGITCRQYDELAFKALNKNPDEVAVILNGGGVARSSVFMQDQNSGTFSVVLLCQKKYMNDVRSAVEDFQKENNATPTVIHYADNDGNTLFTSVKSVFYTPTVSDAQDYPTEDYGTIKAVFMMFTVTVLYGENAIVYPGEYTLLVDGAEYPIKYILSIDSASIPAYDSYLAQGEDRNTQIPIIKANSWAFTIVKRNNADSLQALFANEIAGEESGLWGHTLAVIPSGFLRARATKPQSKITTKATKNG